MKKSLYVIFIFLVSGITTLLHAGVALNSANTLSQYKGTIDSPPAAERPDYKFRMNVAIADDGYDDPIKFPNQAGRSHHHLYLGNGYIDHLTTNDPDIINDHSLNFDQRPIDFMEGNGVNRSAYWVPVMYNHGPDGEIGSQAAQADDFPMGMGFNQIYYVKGNALSDTAWESAIKPMPAGLKIITGIRQYVFNCGFRDDPESTYFIPENGGPNNWPDGFWDPNRGEFIPQCDTTVSNNVTMRITFPDCWDGINLTDKDNDNDPSSTSPGTTHDHMTYSNWNNGCPTTHPIQLGTVQYNFYFPIKTIHDDTSKYYLSADVSMADGYSMLCSEGENGCTNHGDWMNGWEPSIMEKMVNPEDGCLGSKMDHCANGKIDHDEALESSNSGNTDMNFESISINYEFKHRKPILMLMPSDPMRGDCTGDKVIDISDVVCTINVVLSTGLPNGNGADVNDDGTGTVDISDVIETISLVLLP